MSGKKMSIKPKPRQDADTADAWVNERDTEPLKRLTVEIPASFHAHIKAQCAQRGVNMKDALIEILQEKFPNAASVGSSDHEVD